MYYVYILECQDGCLYTGWTTDVNRRLKEHNQGRGAKYTRSRLPVVLKYAQKFGTKRHAMQREYQIKQLSRQEKLRLIKRYSSPGNGDKFHTDN